MMRMLLERSGNDLLKSAFDLKRRLAGCQGNAVGDTENMGVNGDQWRAESSVHDDVGGLAANSCTAKLASGDADPCYSPSKTTPASNAA
jgi:hypothetical protein